ncbi:MULTISPECIES: hypothetical protein [unclassified Vibrio]|uniref:Cyanophage outer membrane protein-like beta-barrel domain-containing protein n=1 Tax=Vibrio sp. HB236076 TaxID=3232307 RepID=A0AB39HAX3_9VIBR|nr:hypothetical protein [Vibrio sp. HB161653]MDP5253686.1 hypothetical protein [Vibrio sp. HB161653]
MKKLAVILLASATPLFAHAAPSPDANYDQGLDVGIAFDQGLSGVLELNDQYRFTLGNDGGAFDYIFKRGTFNANVPFSWYTGVGAWTEWDNRHDDDFGVRVPLGLNMALTNHVETYAEVQPALQIHDDTELELGAAIGITYRF